MAFKCEQSPQKYEDGVDAKMITLPFDEIDVVFEIFEVKSEENPVTNYKHDDSNENKNDPFNSILL